VLRPAHVEYNNSKRMRLYTLWQGGTCILADGATDAPALLCAPSRRDLARAVGAARREPGGGDAACTAGCPPARACASAAPASRSR
jgi:hypothetical protein